MRDRVDHGVVRPFFRVLAVVPAALCWFGLYIALTLHPGVQAAHLQDWWLVILSAFLSIMFTLAVVQGYVPGWLWRMIPHSGAWDTRRK